MPKPQRPQCSVYIATSLDGFIAREDGDIEWLNAISAKVPKGEDMGYGAFMASIDVLVMGRKSFEKVMSFGAWPYGDTQTVVLTRRGVEVPEALKATVSTTAEPLPTLVERLGQEGAKRLYIDGGQLVQSFLREGLIDDLTITLIPTLLGGGIPLFGDLGEDIHLEAISTTLLPVGMIQVQYRVVS